MLEIHRSYMSYVKNRTTLFQKLSGYYCALSLFYYGNNRIQFIKKWKND
jgi:hypothetical protein